MNWKTHLTVVGSMAFLHSVTLSGACQHADSTRAWRSIVESIEDARQVSNGLSAWKDLSNLPSSEKTLALRELVGSDVAGVGIKAALIMIDDQSPDAVAHIGAQLGEWDPSAQAVVLAEIIQRDEQETMCELGRIVLRNLFLGDDNPKMGDDSKAAINRAAAIVSESTLPEDSVLLTKSLRAYPSAPNLWLALDHESITEYEMTLAVSTFTAEGNDIVLRVAAATAVASMNPAADAFVAKTVRSRMDQFGKMSMREVVEQMASGLPIAKDHYREFQKTGRLIGMMQYLPDPTAKAIIADALNVANEELRMIAALVAIERWPDLVGNLERGSFSEMEFANLMAHFAQRCPEKADLIRQRIAPQELELAAKRLADHGWIAAFPSAGPVVAGL